MLLTYNELRELVEQGCIENVKPEQINGASIDLTLGEAFYYESSSEPNRTVDLSAKEAPGMCRKLNSLILRPGEFCLAQTQQVFHLPDDIAGHFMLKSSLARAGLNHLMAGWADPTWHSSVLTLEYKNELKWHNLMLRQGMKCGQMIFWRGQSVPEEVSYAAKGQYNGDKSAQQSKGAR